MLKNEIIRLSYTQYWLSESYSEIIRTLSYTLSYTQVYFWERVK